MKKKALQPFESSPAAAAPRALAPMGAEATGYPSAAELVASNGEWGAWLQEALRSILRPAALAGALGVAAAGGYGCDAATADASSALTPCDAPAATLAPLGAPVLPPPPAPPPAFTSVVMTPVPAQPDPASQQQPPRVRPPRIRPIDPHPPHIRGRISLVRP